MQKIFILIIILLLSISIFEAQTKVPILKKGGVYEVPCKLNGKNTKFIFDSGASDVQISKEFFEEGLKTGIFRSNDLFSDIVEYKVANGSIVQGRNVNIRHLKIGDLNLYNVLGSIIDSPNTPMLLGQSAIEQFGSYTVDYKNLTLTINGNKKAKIESEFISQSKKASTKSTGVALLKALTILPDLEFELTKIYFYESNGGQFTISFEITNNSKLNYDWLEGAVIYYSIEVTTEDGKRYMSLDSAITQSLESGQTCQGGNMIFLGDKSPTKLRVVTKLPGL